jgi:hypothetical protein
MKGTENNLYHFKNKIILNKIVGTFRKGGKCLYPSSAL